MKEIDRFLLMLIQYVIGVYKDMKQADVHIDITSIPELSQHSVTNNKLMLGGNMTLTDTMDVIRKLSQENDKYFGYLKNVWDHLDVVANVPVRNVNFLACYLFPLFNIVFKVFYLKNIFRLEL